MALLLIFGTSSIYAQNINIPDTTDFANGSTISIPIYTSDVTGLDIYSTYAKVSFDETVLDATGASKIGTIAAGWDMPTVNTNNDNEIIVSISGTNPISGSGVLLFLEFTVVGNLGDYSGLVFEEIYFNEGTPTYASLTNGSTGQISKPAPIITGQLPLSTQEEIALDILLDDITVTDADNLYPDGFTLSVQDGTDYTRVGNTITPVTAFTGTLTVPIIVNDGVNNSLVYNLSVTVTASNDVPVITGVVAPLTTPEETGLLIELTNLNVTDDNTYPDDFTLSVGDGTNYTRIGNTITPDLDFTGNLTVPVIVNDGTFNSASYDLSIAVTNINDIPVIIDVVGTLSANVDTPIDILLSNLTVTDVDNIYPTGFSLIIEDGINYTHIGNTVTPASGFSGILTVPVKVNDGSDDSEVYNLLITVTQGGAVSVGLPDISSFTPGESISIPLTCSDITGEEVYSIYAKINFDETVINAIGVTNIGTISSIWGPASVNTDTDGQIIISSFGNNPLTGAGTLLNLEFEIIGGAGDYTDLVFVEFGLNEGNPLSITSNGSLGIYSNDQPVITGQSPLTIQQGVAMEILLDHLTVNDTDNTYPDDFTLTVNDGANYTRVGTTITPNVAFTGTLTVPVSVNDGTDESSLYNMSITVVEFNEAPIITGVIAPLSTQEETALTISLNDLVVTDGDNSWPTDFTLSVQDGTNYTRVGNTITPVTDFTGDISIPVYVSDGTNNSNIYILTVTVTNVNDAPIITGVVSPLSTIQNTDIEIMLADLTVLDIDNTYPSDFTLSVVDGPNYSITGNIIHPATDYVGFITVPVTVNDGTNDSEIFNLTVNVNDASSINVMLPNSSDFTPGTSVTIPVSCSDLTGADIYSLYAKITYDAAEITATNVSKSGTITDSWGAPTINLDTPGEVIISMFGAAPLTGSGVLLNLEFDIIGGSNNYSNLIFSEFVFNEGTPSVNLTNGSIGLYTNFVPVITGQNALTTVQVTPITISLDVLIVNDDDNVFPADFTLTVNDGVNYTRIGNTITPVGAFLGDLTVPVIVNDGTDNSSIYNLTVTVVEYNEQPLITGQLPISIFEESDIEITPNDLIVIDSDNSYPADFTLTVHDGADYTHTGNTILPTVDFVGNLTVLVSVNDGIVESEIFDMAVTVINVNDIPVITGETNQLVAEQETALTIVLTDLTVTDVDNNWSSDFTLTVLDGTDYSRVGNTITPNVAFSGELTVPVTVNDGTDNSAVYNLTVSVVPVGGAHVSLPFINDFTPGSTITIPITTTDLTGLDVYSIYATVSFDETVIDVTGVSKTGTMISNWGNPTVNTGVDGEVTFSVFGATPLSGNGTLVNLEFDVVGQVSDSTALTFELFTFNEGDPQVILSNGQLGPATLDAPVNLTLNKTGNILTLDWDPVLASNAKYTVYSSDDAYDFSSATILTSNISATTWSLSVPVSDNKFYYVTANIGSLVSQPSNTVGFVKYECITTASTNLNFIAVPMDLGNGSGAGGEFMASDLGNMIGTSNVATINKWDPTTQSWIGCTYIGWLGAWDGDFEITQGNAYMIDVLNNTDVYMAGNLPVEPQYDLVNNSGSTSLNFMMVPLSKTALINASELGEDIGMANIATVNTWDATTQAWIGCTYIDWLGAWDGDFVIQSGKAYMVDMKTNISWPNN